MKSARSADRPACAVTRDRPAIVLEPEENTPLGCAVPGGMMAGISVLSPVLAAIARHAMR